MKYQTVIFDLDGTLTDTLGDLHSAVNFALRHFGYPERTIDEVRSFVGNGVRNLIKRAMPENVSEADFSECLTVFKRYYGENSCVLTKPYDGIVEMLEKLREKGIKTAVVTNKTHDAANGIVEHFFGSLIDETVGQIDGVFQKPEPDGIFTVMQKFGAQKESTVYVGDSEVDCLTAKNAEIPCIGVTWGFRSKEVLLENGAQFIIDRPEEIFEII